MKWEDRFGLCLYRGKSQIGIKHGNWTVLGYARHTRSRIGGHNKISYWKCRCEGCGEVFDVIAVNVTSGLSGGCVRCGSRKNRGCSNPFWKGYGEVPSSLWTRCKHSAKNRGICFRLTLRDMSRQWKAQKGICPVTGMKLVMLATHSLGKKKLGKFLDSTPVASLDRIDNIKGYEKGNVVWVHKAANIMRNAFDMTFFVDMCRRIAEYNSIVTK